MTSDARTMLLERVKETPFQQQVMVWANRAGWLCHAMRDSRKIWWGADRGVPDLVLVRRPRVIFAELKTERGRVSADQDRWHQALRHCPGVEMAVWRPTDEAEIKKALA